jgi:hypothetical protein
MIGDNFAVDLSQIDPETLRDVQALYEAEAMQGLVDNVGHRQALGYANHAGAVRKLGQEGLRFSPTQRDYFWMQRYHKADWDDPDFVQWFQGTDAGAYSRVRSVPDKIRVGFTGERKVSFKKAYV